MQSIMNRLEQAVSVTDMSRGAGKLLDSLKKGDQQQFVIMRNNAPEAVLIAAAEFQRLLDELEDLRVEALAKERLATLDEENTVSHADMLDEFTAGR